MKFTIALASAMLAATVSAYTEVTQWSGYYCGRGDGFRTSYLHIYGNGVYINRDNAARSIYVEAYDNSPPTYFYSQYGGNGYITDGPLRGGYCYVWDNEGAYSIANPYNRGFRGKRETSIALIEGSAVAVDEEHLGLGGKIADEIVDEVVDNVAAQ